MSQVQITHDVLTLQEAADYLRVSEELIGRLAEDAVIPARRVGSEWRFLKYGLNEWLQGRDQASQSRSSVVTDASERGDTAKDSRTALLQQAGLFLGDRDLDQIRKDAYRLRGRPEVDEPAAS